MSRAFLVVLGHRDAIRWVLRHRRMAFPATPREEVRSLDVGDRLFLYATRKAWNNPERDRGRVIGAGVTASPVRVFDQPVELAERKFVSGCELTIDGLVPFPGGVELQPLVSELDAFPRPEIWSVYLRRALVRLSSADADLLAAQLSGVLKPIEQALDGYLDAANV